MHNYAILQQQHQQQNVINYEAQQKSARQIKQLAYQEELRKQQEEAIKYIKIPIL